MQWSIFLLLVSSVISGFLGTWLARFLAWRYNMTSDPNPIVVQHRTTIAYLGGAGIAAGAGFVIAVWYLVSGIEPDTANLITRIAGPTLAFLMLGLIDDLRPFKPLTKLLLQFSVASWAASIGISAPLTGYPAVDATVSVIWIVTVINAVNFTDVCDGLVGGLSIISLLSIAVMVPVAAVPCVVLAGATSGFMFFNAPPASIFLGDAGSHLLGFVIGAVILLGLGHQDAQIAPYIAPLLVGVPLFELFFISAMRHEKGLSIFRGSPDHFALRMQANGFTRWQIDLFAWLAAGLMASVAIISSAVSNVTGIVLTGFVLLACAVVWARLKRWDTKDELSQSTGS